MSREPTTLIILAGGEAKRMGFPKHQLAIDGERVIDRLHERLSPLFVETIVVGRDIEELPSGVRLVGDLYAVRSPLVGIHGGLTVSTTDLTFVVACDMPHIEPALVEHLLGQAGGADVVVPVVRGYYEPLCAVYRKSCLTPIDRMLRERDLKVSALYSRVQSREVAQNDLEQLDPTLRTFANLNVPHRSTAAARLE
ncbi:molybdenum cofactor guanylyltransferase [Candidatus Bipolaricaulota bacterium]